MITGQVFTVGLIQNHKHVLGDFLQERLDGVRRVNGTRRVVRVGDKHEASAISNRYGHGVQIVPPFPGRHRHTPGTDGLCYQGVDSERVLGENHFGICIGETTGNDFQYIVGAVTKGNLIHPDVQTLRKRLLQVESVAIGIQTKLGEGLPRGRQRFFARPQRVFVARQLDDLCRIEAKLTGQLFNRLARLIR